MEHDDAGNEEAPGSLQARGDAAKAVRRVVSIDALCSCVARSAAAA
jgi:hypothetical protein